MKVGIDSYCYHRFFGEVYPQQNQPSHKITVQDFIERAKALGVEGVSLESCFLPHNDSGPLQNIKEILDQCGLDRVYAWGHPDGLEGGTNQEAYREMIGSFEKADRIGAKVMRVVGSSLQYRHQPHGPQLERLAALFRDAVKVAQDWGIKLAIENHIDFTSSEMVQLLEAVDSPYLGIDFDTGNFLRLLDDPIKAMEKLAPHVLATHIKDLKPQHGVPADEWYFFSSTPIGDGLIDNDRLVKILASVGFVGILAVEIDFLHLDYQDEEDAAVARSVRELQRLVRLAEPA